MKKLIFQLLFLATFQILFFGITFAQSNYSKTTIDELKTLRGNVLRAINGDDTLSIARAYYKLALKFDYIGERDSCDLYYKMALDLAHKLKNNKAIAVISNTLATTYSDKGLHNKAIKVYKETIKRFLSLSDSVNAAGVKLNLASEYMDLAQFKTALEISLDALKMKLATSDSSNLAGFYGQIGVLFNSVGNKQKWIQYTITANNLAKKNEKYGDFYRRMDILNELGAYYLSEHDFETATKYYDTLHTQSIKNDYKVGITVSLSSLIPILKEQKKYSEALILAKQALKLSESVKNVYRILTNMIEKARLELLLSQKNIAEKTLLEANNIALKFNFPNEMITINNLLSDIYADKGNYKKAYTYQKKYEKLSDSLKSIESKKNIAELDTKYQSELKDTKINSLHHENLAKQEKIKLQERTVIGLVLLGVITIIIFILVYTQSKLKGQFKILNLDQKLLRSQMNPHFIFNALIAIQNYILTNKKFEASDYLSKFAMLMRSILESSRGDFITLAQEIDLLKNYVSLQQLRFENSFNFVLEIDKNLDLNSMQFPPMILQPFVENAIEHGLRKIEDREKFLIIKYILNFDKLFVSIEDNGIGIGDSELTRATKHRSFAMQIVNERIKNIAKIYKEDISIEIKDYSKDKLKNGTVINFSIPIKLLTKKSND